MTTTFFSFLIFGYFATIIFEGVWKKRKEKEKEKEMKIEDLEILSNFIEIGKMSLI